jgi:hypothetical protein
LSKGSGISPCGRSRPIVRQRHADVRLYLRLHQAADFVGLYAFGSETFDPPLLTVVDEPNYWYANIDPLYVKYVSNDTAYGMDLSIWSETFNEYVVIAARGQNLQADHGQDPNDDLKKAEKRALAHRAIERRDGRAGRLPAAWNVGRHPALGGNVTATGQYPLMGKVNSPLQVAFNRGEVSRYALARVDIERMRLSAESRSTGQPWVLGPMMLRPGLQHCGGINDDLTCRLLPFIFSNTDLALIELTDSR